MDEIMSFFSWVTSSHAVAVVQMFCLGTWVYWSFAYNKKYWELRKRLVTIEMWVLVNEGKEIPELSEFTYCKIRQELNLK